MLDRSLDTAGGKGLFVKELDEALLSGRVDLCVHSCKDMPVPDDPELPVVAVGRREDPRDVLVLPPGRDADDIGGPIGTSSARRRRLLRDLFPGRAVETARGNVQTRLRKLDAGEYGALVLAAAGLRRLGLWERATRVFTVREMTPAAGQGILAVQARRGEAHPWLDGFHCPETWDARLAERAFVEGLGATCASPVAAHAVVSGDELILDAMRVDDDGGIHRGTSTGKRRDAVRIGRELAERLASKGRET